MLLFIAISACALALGPVAASLVRIRDATLRAIDVFVLVTICGLAAFHVLAEAIEQCGGRAAVAAVAGVGALTAVEHFPKGRRQALASAEAIGILAVAAHAFFDGAALAFSNGPFLAAATAIHRVPEGLVVWSLARPDRRPKRATAIVAAVIAINALGAAVGSSIAPLMRSEVVTLVQAFAMGSLVHILFERSALTKRTDASRANSSTIVGVFAGILAVALVTIVSPDHDLGTRLAPGVIASHARLVLGLLFVALVVWLLGFDARRLRSAGIRLPAHGSPAPSVPAAEAARSDQVA